MIQRTSKGLSCQLSWTLCSKFLYDRFICWYHFWFSFHSMVLVCAASLGSCPWAVFGSWALERWSESLSGSSRYPAQIFVWCCWTSRNYIQLAYISIVRLCCCCCCCASLVFGLELALVKWLFGYWLSHDILQPCIPEVCCEDQQDSWEPIV